MRFAVSTDGAGSDAMVANERFVFG